MASVHQEPAIQTPPLMARKTPMQWFTNGCVHYVEPLIGGPYLFAVIRPLLVVGLVFLPLYGQSGRHWAVRGPVAAMQLGQTSAAYLGKISMSVASGEAVAMIQPFCRCQRAGLPLDQWPRIIGLPSTPRTLSHDRRSERELVISVRVPTGSFVPSMVYTRVAAIVAAQAEQAAAAAALAAASAGLTVIAARSAADPLNKLMSKLELAPAIRAESVHCQNAKVFQPPTNSGVGTL